MIALKKPLTGETIPYEKFNFGGGETHIKINDLEGVYFVDVLMKLLLTFLVYSVVDVFLLMFLMLLLILLMFFG
jgi:hypothetical protein